MKHTRQEIKQMVSELNLRRFCDVKLEFADGEFSLLLATQEEDALYRWENRYRIRVIENDPERSGYEGDYKLVYTSWTGNLYYQHSYGYGYSCLYNKHYVIPASKLRETLTSFAGKI